MASGVEAHRLAAQLADVGRRLASVSAALEGEAGSKGSRGSWRANKNYGKGTRDFGDFVPDSRGTVGSRSQRAPGPKGQWSAGQGSGKSRRKPPAGAQPFQGPMWDCLGCGSSSNFAIRALDGSGCRSCGAAAHKADFRKADEWWTEVHGHAYQRAPVAAAPGNGAKAGAAAQVPAVTSSPPAVSGSEGAEAQSESKPNEQKLRQELKATQDMLAAAKRIGEGGETWVEQLGSRVEALKKEISSCRPVEAQLRGAFAKQEAAMADKNRLQAVVADLKTKLLSAEKQCCEAVDVAAQATKDLQLLQSQLEFADSSQPAAVGPESQVAGLLALLASVPEELRSNAEPLVQHFVKQGTAVQEGKAGEKRPCEAGVSPGAKAHCAADTSGDVSMPDGGGQGPGAEAHGAAASQQQRVAQQQLAAQQQLQANQAQGGSGPCLVVA